MKRNVLKRAYLRCIQPTTGRRRSAACSRPPFCRIRRALRLYPHMHTAECSTSAYTRLSRNKLFAASVPRQQNNPKKQEWGRREKIWNTKKTKTYEANKKNLFYWTSRTDKGRTLQEEKNGVSVNDVIKTATNPLGVSKPAPRPLRKYCHPFVEKLFMCRQAFIIQQVNLPDNTKH